MAFGGLVTPDSAPEPASVTLYIDLEGSWRNSRMGSRATVMIMMIILHCLRLPDSGCPAAEKFYAGTSFLRVPLPRRVLPACSRIPSAIYFRLKQLGFPATNEAGEPLWRGIVADSVRQPASHQWGAQRSPKVGYGVISDLEQEFLGIPTAAAAARFSKSPGD
eukprot:682940-Rhodomonas_salina.2